MARIRSIKPEYWSSGQVMDCSRDARLLFIGLWNFCDDMGRFPCSGKQIKALVFPGDDDLNSTIIRRLIDELAANGLLSIYIVDDKEYVEIGGWRHQKIDKPQAAKYPAPVVEPSTNDQRQVSTDRRGEDRIGSDDTLTARTREADFRIAITQAYSEVGSLKQPDTGRAAVWLAQGYDPVISIAAIRATLAKKPNVPLAYCDGPIADAHVKPEGVAKSTGPPREAKRDPFLKNFQSKLERASHERDSDPTIINSTCVAGQSPIGGGVHVVGSGASGPRLADTG